MPSGRTLTLLHEGLDVLENTLMSCLLGGAVTFVSKLVGDLERDQADHQALLFLEPTGWEVDNNLTLT